MNSHTRRRDDRSAAPTDPFKQWVPTDKYPLDHDSERRRNRSTTLPSHSYDPRPNPSHDTRYNDPKLPPRSHRQDPHYPPATSYAYHHSSAHASSTSKAYQHATRSSAQHASSGHHYPQPSSYQPSHPAPAYQVASSSRRQHTEAPDPGASRRPPSSTNQTPYNQFSTGEDMPRSSARPSRAIHTSLQPSYSAPANQTFWNPPQESSSRRHKDAYRDRGREQDRERDREREGERDKSTAELENRYKDRARGERYRERDRERVTEVRHQEQSRPRPHDRRKDPDTEGVLYSEQRNPSKVSLSGREAYSSSVREPGNGHRRYRTEDGTASTGRRHQPEITQNSAAMLSHSITVPPADVQQTGEPPPAPRVMPVYLPPKGKSQRSHRDGRPSTAQGAQSGSDTERATGKHRMERTPSGPAVQRSDAHTSTSSRDRGNQDLQMGPRDDVKRPEVKYRAHSDTRQPLAQINVDIPLVTPGFNASALPTDARTSTAPQIVSIRAGQGPSDPHDAHFKSSTISHSAASQEIVHPLHPSSASIVKSSSHTRSYPYEVRAQYDRPPVTVENSRTGDDLPPGPRVSIHESGRAFPTPVSKPYARGNPETAVDVSGSSYLHSRPPSRSAHRTSANNIVPPAVVGPRPLRSISQGPQTNEPTTSVTHHVSNVSSVPTQHFVPPSPAHPINNSPPKAGQSHSSLSSVQPNPKYVQLHGVSPSHSTSTQQAPSVLPSVHPTPIFVPRTLTAPSRPLIQADPYTDAPYTHQQPTDQQPATNSYPESQRKSNGTTVKTSWVVQTSATAKRANISREDKYLGDHHLDLETRQAQLRQVLSQDNESFRRASSSMMKISQATTPSALSQRNSPGTKARDVSFGTPRGTSAGNSPKSGSAKEASTPEHVLRQNLAHLAGPPQIAVVGSTPITTACDLPQGRVDHALLAPPFPAPTRASRTTSGSQDQSHHSQPAVRNTSPASYQSQLVPAVHAPSLFQPFQPYQPPSPPAPEDGGRFSPPPLPIPPPRGLEDSPPLPIETRTSEILPTRSHSAGDPDTRSVPEVQSEMFHVPSQLSSMAPPRATQPWQPSQGDSNTAPTPISNGSVVAAHSDARSQNRAFALPDDVPVAHQEIMRSVSIVPPQSFAPTRPRPKVTVEDVPEDSLVLSKGIPTNVPMTPSVSASRPTQPFHNTTVSNASPMSKSAVVDTPGHKSSPQSKSKDPPLHRNTELTATSIAPPMPAPTPVSGPTPTRVPSSAPPTQPTFPPSSHAAPAQRATSHAVSSRATQRAAEMLRASKFSPSAGANPGATGNVNKSTIASITHNPVSTTTNQSQPPNAASIQGPLASRLVNAPTTIAAPPNTSVASMANVAILTTTPGSGPPVGAPGLHASGSSNSTQLPFAPDPFKHQPSRPGAVSIPSLDATSTTVTPTATGKNAHPEQPIPESIRSREVASSAIRNAAPSHIYPSSTRPDPSSAITQQTPVIQAQPSTHYRTVSLPMTSSSSAVHKPPSPRKYSQPISSTTVSTQPFPSHPSAPEPQSARVATPGHLSVPAPVRSTRLSPPDHANDFDMLKTPSSIAPSPMLNPDSVPQPIAAPIRARQASTDSKDDKKKASGLFGLFRTRTLSSKAVDPPTVSPVSGASLGQGRVHPDPSIVPSIATPVLRGATSTSAPKELHSVPPPVASTATRTGSQSKLKSRIPDPVTIPSLTQAVREHKESTPHLFTPFKFLTMHSKRNRTVSAASLDVCDGYTATTTMIGSPNHSTVSQAQPLPGIMPPDVRDPLAATSEWRDREEADRRELRTHRIRRPGVTFDLEEEPPSPAPGTTSKRKKLVRRPSGRAPTPGPPRG